MNQRALVGNAGDAAQVRSGRETEKRRQAREDAELKEMLSYQSGRGVLWRVIADCGVFTSSDDMSARVYYREGQRAAGLRLIAQINRADPDAFLRMQLDQLEQEKRERAAPDPKAKTGDTFEDFDDGN